MVRAMVRREHLMRVDAVEARDRDAEYLDAMTLAERRRHDRIEARLLKEGRVRELDSSERDGVADRTGVAGAGERVDASGGAGDGVHREEGNRGGRGGGEGRSGADRGSARGRGA